ncbi:InlB B-repeat-containing protein, partial [Rubritalea profundi]
PLTVVNGSGNGSYVPGTDVAITADSPAENYHFDKWISSDGKIISDLTASDNYSMPGYATTITATYALNTYHLSFDQQGGEGGATTATAIYGKAMPLATVPTRTGYLFRGYFSETFGEGTQYYTYQMQSANNWDVTADTVLYAHWSPFHTLIQEDFESPVVSGYGAGSSPDNGKWVRSPNDSHGIVNKDGNAFSAPDPNHQAYAFWSEQKLTTTEGALGVLEAGATYRFSFDVVVDLDNDEPGYFGTHYSVELMAFDPFRDTSGQNTGTVLASRSGDAPRDRTFKTVSFEFTADPDSHATEIGKALGFRIHGDSSSASYDNVIIEMINPPHRLSYDDNGADSGAVPVSIIEEFHPGEVVTVLGNTGSLSKDSFTFAGWNTAANGTGTTYTSGQTFYITSDITLYAQWYNSDASIIHYSAGMGGSISGDTTQFILSGSNGTSVTAVPDNTTYTFDQWSDGSTNATRQELSVSSNVTLTASFVLRKATQWSDANWSPLHLPSTELWLDAADTATVVMSGDSATSWHDKSGYGRHAVPDPASQPTYSTDSFNGSPTLEFATADEMIAEIPSNTFSSGINVYMVLKKHAYAYGDKFPFLRLKDGKAAPFKGRWDTGGYFNNRYVGDGSAEVSTFRKGIFPGAGSPLLLSIGIDATTYTEMYNVVSGWSGAHSGTYGDTASDVIIGRGYTAYDISEVVVTGSLEPEDRLKMEGYLAWKWLMEDNLPEGHRFKDMPPKRQTRIPFRLPQPLQRTAIQPSA